MHLIGSSHGIYFKVYPQTTFLVTQMYTNIHSHQHKITQLTCIHLVHTYNIWTFDICTSWSLLHLLSNWWVHQKIDFQNYSFHTLTSSVSMVFQNSWHTLGSILHIYCPNSKKLYDIYWLVEMFQCNPIGVLIIYAWKNTLINNLEYPLMMLDTRCLQ